MSVITRRPGESLVINDDTVATIHVIDADLVELSVARIDGAHLGTIPVRARKSAQVVEGLWAAILKVEPGKVRIGLSIGPATGEQIEEVLK
jgi:sRNA-binding carbon storage regulator CsrA